MLAKQHTDRRCQNIMTTSGVLNCVFYLRWWQKQLVRLHTCATATDLQPTFLFSFDFFGITPSFTHHFTTSQRHRSKTRREMIECLTKLSRECRAGIASDRQMLAYMHACC